MELCVLAIVRKRESYGYEIVERLKLEADLDFSESTVYPVLARLHREKHMAVRKVASASGPARRYFRLTPSGEARYQEMVQQWMDLNQRVSQLTSEGEQ